MTRSLWAIEEHMCSFHVSKGNMGFLGFTRHFSVMQVIEVSKQTSASDAFSADVSVHIVAHYLATGSEWWGGNHIHVLQHAKPYVFCIKPCFLFLKRDRRHVVRLKRWYVCKSPNAQWNKQDLKSTDIIMIYLSL